MSRRSLVIGSLVGAVAIHFVFVACSGMTEPADAGHRTDTGSPVADVIHDAVQHVRDSEIATADAQIRPPAMEVACDQESFSRTVQSGTTQTVRQYFASIPVAGLDPAMAPHVTAVACGRVMYGTYPRTPCQVGQECSVSATPHPGTVDCLASPIITIESGRVLVQCGFRSTVTNAGGTVNDYGEKFERVHVRVEL